MSGESGPMTAAQFHVLLALSDGEKHGYAIMLEVEEQTDGRVRLGPGTLYGILKRLLDQGFIEELRGRRAAAEDERRRTYRLRRRGRKAAEAEARRLERAVSLARSKSLLPGVAGGGVS